MRPFLGWLIFLLGLLADFAGAADGNLQFGVNEGSSSSLDAMFRHEKYVDMSAYLGAASGKKIKTETSNNLPILVRNLAKSKYDILLVRPSHIAARAIRDNGYRLLAAAKGESRLHFIVRADSPLKNLSDMRGHRIAFPDELSYPTQLGRAVMRDAGIDPAGEKIQAMDRQEAVGYAVMQNMVDAGVVISYSKVGKDWLNKGGRFLYSKEGLPFWSILVSSKVGEATEAKLKAALLNMENTPKGQALLKEIGIQGFVAGNQKSYLDMLAWVEGKPQR